MGNNRRWRLIINDSIKPNMRNSLYENHPEIARQWHPALNGDVLPNQVAARSNKKYYWLCEKGHVYQNSPDKRVRGENCPYCNNRRVLVGYNDLETVYPNIAKEWDCSQNTGSPKDYTYRSTYNAHWKCSTCGNEWTAHIRDRVDSKYQICPKCSAKKRGEERHRKALQKSGCITNPLLLAEWDYERNEKGPDEYTPMSNEDAYWICSKCGYHYKAKINNRSNGRGCACCAGKIVVAGINDLATTHPKLAAEWHPTRNGGLRPMDVSYGMADKVWWLCPEGHEYQASILHRSSGTNCPICNAGRQTSFAEQAVFYYVRKVFPDAISHYRDIFDNGMELDIYIPSIKLGIEYDGEAWHRSNTRVRDKRKWEICQANNIRLFRVKEKTSDEDRGIADEILSLGNGPMYQPQNLRKVIRLLLDKIDPETNMWTGTKPIFHSRVDINLERDEAEIRSYMTTLRKGSLADEYPEIAAEWHPIKNESLLPDKVKPYSDIKAWWICPVCRNEYYTSVGHRVDGTGCPKCGVRKSRQSKEKPVHMVDLETNKVIKQFISISEASRQMKISSGNISAVCKGVRRHAGGYGWRFTDGA